MKTLKFLVAIWCTQAVHWLFSELCGYGACFCAASVLHHCSACCQCISWSMHTCLDPPPPDVLNWVTREASGGDDKIFHVKLLKRCTKTKNCRWALFMFPFEVLPFHSRLDDPTALDHKQWEDVEEEEGIHVCTYCGHQINPSFILLTFEWLEKCCTVHQCLLYSLISAHQKGQIFLEWNLDFMQIVPVFFCN